MIKINPYLNFPGNTEEAFKFYKSVFGGEFQDLIRYNDMPMEGVENMPEADKSKIMHMSMPIGNGNLLMATDAMESMGQKLVTGNNVYLSVTVDSKDEAKKIYDKLSAGGTIEMPIEDVSWGSYFGMFKDKFGTQWMVSYDYPKE